VTPVLEKPYISVSINPENKRFWHFTNGGHTRKSIMATPMFLRIKRSIEDKWPLFQFTKTTRKCIKFIQYWFIYLFVNVDYSLVKDIYKHVTNCILCKFTFTFSVVITIIIIIQNQNILLRALVKDQLSQFFTCLCWIISIS
jgi:uncharacterized membrane protein YagU involved in acid resistance